MSETLSLDSRSMEVLEHFSQACELLAPKAVMAARRECWFRTAPEAPWQKGFFHCWASKTGGRNGAFKRFTNALVESELSGRMFEIHVNSLAFQEPGDDKPQA